MSAENGKVSWHGAIMRVVATTATHPLELTKFLIQIGHEPIAPQPSTTIFGRPALALPNVFQYLRHIKRVNGWSGCYRGLGIRLVSQSVCIYAYHCTSEVLKTHEIFHNERIERKSTEPKEDGDAEDSEDEDEEDEGIFNNELPMSERRIRFLRQLGSKLSCRSVAIIVSQPFHVAALRAMAQFVGRETRYNGVMGAIVGVYKENGICGFWSGVSPRLAGEITAITLSASLTFLVRSYVLQDKALGNLISAVMSFIASSLTYPFHVVASCMSIRGSTLKAALPTNMPGSYTSWIGCWHYLRAEGQIMRGSSLLWRYYSGPQVVIGGRAIPLEPFKTY